VNSLQVRKNLARVGAHPAFVAVRNAVWGLVCGNHQGQRSNVPRQQAGYKTASDNASVTEKGLAKQEPSTQDETHIQERHGHLCFRIQCYLWNPEPALSGLTGGNHPQQSVAC
jgi:hypothetical protein